MAANRIVDLRAKDNSDGRLISLDKGDIGDDDMGVKIEFRNVWFKYPTRDVPVLSGLSLTVRYEFQNRPGKQSTDGVCFDTHKD